MNKTMVILRGPPGSGKSMVAVLLDGGIGFVVHSLDLWRMDDGKYKFDPDKEKEVVANYKEALRASMKCGDSIVIDNCNSRLWEYKVEKEMAEKNGYTVHVLEVQASFWDCMSRQKHNVPQWKMRQIFDRWETPISSSEETRLDGLEMAMHAVLQSQQHVENAVQDFTDKFGEKVVMFMANRGVRDPAAQDTIEKVEKALADGRKPRAVIPGMKDRGVVIASDERADVSEEQMDAVQAATDEESSPNTKSGRAEMVGNQPNRVWDKEHKMFVLTKKDQETDG